MRLNIYFILSLYFISKSVGIILLCCLLLFAGCAKEVIDPILPPDPPLSDECELLDYYLKYELNSFLSADYKSKISDDTIVYRFPHFTDISSVISSFEISDLATIYLDTTLQTSDITSNSFKHALDYTIIAENDSNSYSFVIKSEFPLVFSTIGHSNDSFRVGGGDFSKESLLSVNNILNGKWDYNISFNDFSYSSSVKVSDNSFTIPNFISEDDWLDMNGGEDFEFPISLSLSCDSIGIKDSVFVFNILREQYTVRSWQDLQYISKDLDGHYEMKKDVHFPLPGTYGFPTEGFIPLGDSIAHPFKGSLNGNNHIIHDFYIRRDSDTTRYVGLFGYVERKLDIIPLIKNLGIEISTRDERGGVSGGWFTGGLVGWNEGKILNCYVKGSVESKGLVGEPSATGGLVGFNNKGEIYNSSAINGLVVGFNQVGGLVGENSNNGLISQSCSSQNVYLSALGIYDDEYDVSAGGFVGRNSLSSQILNSYSTGLVESHLGVGGFVGRHSSSSTIRNCYSASQVLELSEGESKSVGGFIGQLYGSPDRRSVTDSYWNLAANPGLDGVGDGPITGVDGRSTLDFKNSIMFLGWDFLEVWDISSDKNKGMIHLRDVKNP